MRVEIEKIAFGGYGIGRVDGKIVFVDRVIPGELAEIEIIRDKRSYSKAKLIEVLKESEIREDPQCPVFDRCGGCQFQHIEYSEQLKIKQQIFTETLERLGRLKNLKILPIISSSRPYGYRSKLGLSIWFEHNSYSVGYHLEGSSEKLPIDRCPIASEGVNKLLSGLSNYFNNLEFFGTNEFRLHITEGEGIFITATSKDGSVLDLTKVLVNNDEELPGLFNNKYEREFCFDTLGVTFFSVPSVFLQANKYINEKMIETVNKWTLVSANRNVLDLFCGIGNFTLHLAKNSKFVLGIDNSKKAIRLAKKNAQINNCSNIKFKKKDCKDALTDMVNAKAKFDFVLIDPPRQGAINIIPELIELNPKKIIYVSCYPPTLARDLKALNGSGYRVSKIQCFDMLPQTYHIESLTLLQRA